SDGLADPAAVIVMAIGVVHATTITIGPRSAGRIAGVIRPDTKQTLHAADNTTDRATDHGADRTGRIHADRTAVRTAVRNGLSLGADGQGKSCRDNGRGHDVEFHATPLTVFECMASDAQTRRRRGEIMATASGTATRAKLWPMRHTLEQ